MSPPPETTGPAGGAVHPPPAAVREAVTRALAEDLGSLGDVTSALLPPVARVEAPIRARAQGVQAGRLAVEETLAQVDRGLSVRWEADDGAALEAGQALGWVEGPLVSLLTAERTALNFLCHLSGVATLTRRYVEAAAVGAWGRARVADTRKTTPGLRALEKAAVRAGGGVNHRGDLSQWVLAKDNHQAVLPIAELVARARARWPGRTVEVEADRIDQVEEAVAAGADMVLLDNMSPEEVAKAVAARAGSERPLLEVSGGVSLADVGAYAAAGVDLISIGALTHSAPALDIALDLDPVVS